MFSLGPRAKIWNPQTAAKPLTPQNLTLKALKLDECEIVELPMLLEKNPAVSISAKKRKGWTEKARVLAGKGVGITKGSEPAHIRDTVSEGSFVGWMLTQACFH